MRDPIARAITGSPALMMEMFLTWETNLNVSACRQFIKLATCHSGPGAVKQRRIYKRATTGTNIQVFRYPAIADNASQRGDQAISSCADDDHHDLLPLQISRHGM